MTIEKISSNDTIGRVVDAVNELIDATDYIQTGFATDVVQDAVSAAEIGAGVVIDQGLVDIYAIKNDTIVQKDLAIDAKTEAEAARDAALLSRGVFASTADALSKGVAALASLVAGTGGTNGTFDLAFSGGAFSCTRANCR